MIQFIIFCAGAATRLGSLLANEPKHLVDIRGHHILGKIVDNIRVYFDEAQIHIIINPYSIKAFEKFLENQNDRRISIVLQRQPNGTRNALKDYYIHNYNNGNDICAVYGDTIVYREQFFCYLNKNRPLKPVISVSPFTLFDIDATSVGVQGDRATHFAHGKETDQSFRWAGRIYLPVDCKLLHDLVASTLSHPDLNSRRTEQSIGTFLGEFGNNHEIDVVREKDLVNLNTPNDYGRLVSDWRRYFNDLSPSEVRED